ncbi:LysR family transcriptional regulator [Neobacillus mesonae]|uniref:LysR family transcriptional regulator n=1 Tax=Neobacillus mesonae TaxID=1193713 RepID=UPI002574686E|nr:LysR family transcriptional regulator [Neobacillus mesonae]
MNLQQLSYFVTIVEQSSYTAASKKLHISQPSLSNAIKKLEKEVGLILIDRSKKDLKLTKEGEVLYQEAKRFLIHFDHVSAETARLKNEGPLELSIGIIESSNFWVPKILKEFKEEYTKVLIRLIEVPNLKDVETALNEFEIHLAITNQYTNHDHIVSTPLYQEKLAALLPLSHPLKNKDFLTIKDLKNEKFIIPQEGFRTREDILNAFRKSEIKPQIHFETGRFETACDLTEEGLGITIAPENYIKHRNRTNFHIKQIRDSNLSSRTVYLSFHKNRYLPPVVEKFIYLVKDYFIK